MGLTGILKKSKDMTANGDDTAGGMAGAFKGDLAAIQDGKEEAAIPEATAVLEEKETAHDGKSAASEDKDSADSVVFLTFRNDTEDIWYCPECGTANDPSYNGCAVCGFRR